MIIGDIDGLTGNLHTYNLNGRGSFENIVGYRKYCCIHYSSANFGICDVAYIFFIHSMDDVYHSVDHRALCFFSLSTYLQSVWLV